MVVARTVQAMVPPPLKPVWQLHPNEAKMIGAAWEEYFAAIPAAKRGKMIATALEKAPLLSAIGATALVFWQRLLVTAMAMGGKQLRPGMAPPPGWKPPARAAVEEPPPEFQEELREAAAVASEGTEEGPAPPPEDPTDTGFPSAASPLDAELGGTFQP